MPQRSKPSGQLKTLIHADIPEDIVLDKEGIPRSNARLSLLNTSHVSFLLCYYAALKQEC